MMKYQYSEWAVIITILFAVAGIIICRNILNEQLNPQPFTEDYILVYHEGAVIDTIWMKETLDSEVRIENLEESAVVYEEIGDETDQLEYLDMFYHYHTPYRIFYFFYCVLMALSLGSIVPSILQMVRLYNTQNIRPWGWITSFALTALLVGMAVRYSMGGSFQLSGTDIARHFNVIFRDSSKFGLLIGLVVCGALFSVYGSFLVNHAISSLNVDRATFKREGAKYYVRKLSLLDKALRFYLFVSALLITGGTISTELVRSAIYSMIPTDSPLLFPIEYVYLYGLSFTVFLGLIYLPINYHLQYKTEEVKERLAYLIEHPEEEPVEETVVETDQIKKKEDLQLLQEAFNVETSTFDTIKVIVGILAPTISSLLGAFTQL